MDDPTSILKVPTEILVLILSNLGFQDLQTVSLVNRIFYNCCKEKSLMSDIVLSITIDELLYVSQSSRFDNLRNLCLSNQCLSEYTQCFSQLARRVVECEFISCRISRTFMCELLSEILKGTRLKILNLRNSRIIVDLAVKHNEICGYGKALIKLVEVNFWGSSVLEFNQLQGTFRTLHELDTLGNLKSLNMGCIDSLQWIEPNVFGQVLNNLEVLNVRTSPITKTQFQCLLDVMEVKTSLKVLKLGDNRISVVGDICSNQLAKAMNSVEELELWPSEFTFEQMIAILSRIGNQESKLRRVFLDEDTDRYLSASYPDVYPDLRKRISQVVSFSLLPY